MNGPFLSAQEQNLDRVRAFAWSALIAGLLTVLLLFVNLQTPPQSVAAADKAYQVAIWRNLTFYLTDPGLMTWGLGQLLFGWLGWKSDIIPNWLAIIGVVGGAAGLLTLAVYQSPIMALLQLACFAAWGFSIAVLLFRRGHGVVVASVGN